MKVFIHIIVGVCLRAFLYFSRYKQLISNLLLFPISAYSFSSIRENYIYSLMKSTNKDSPLFQSNNTFISPHITSAYNIIKNTPNTYILGFFIACDIIIGLLLYKSKKDEKNGNTHFILALYMYNPVSIVNCVTFRLDILYTMFQLMFFINSSNYIISPLFLVLSLVLSPGYFFINLTYIIYVSITNFQKIKMTLIISTFVLVCFINFSKLLGFNPIDNLLSIYYNYYFIQDTLPNFSDLWTLLSGTFLKYQNFTKEMITIYQFTLCMAVMFLVYRIKDKYYRNKESLAFSMIFLMSHIMDRYPCENHYIICLILLFQHWDVIKEKIMTLAVYCSVAGYTLIVCRGFPYSWRKSGSSNYLYFQNVTYEIAMTFILMCAVNGIDTFRQNWKDEDRLKQEIEMTEKEKEKVE